MRYSQFPTQLLQRTTRRNVRIQPGQTSTQRVHNTLARVATGLRRRDHITPALEELHWLPIRAIINVKVATFVYRLRERRQPPYLADLISDDVPTRTLRSSTKVVGDAGSGTLMENYFFKKQAVMLYEIYFIKHYHFSIISNIIILWLKLFKLTHGYAT